MNAEERELLSQGNGVLADVIKSLPTDDEIDNLIAEQAQELSSHWISGYWLRKSEAEEIMYKIRDKILKKFKDYETETGII